MALSGRDDDTMTSRSPRFNALIGVGGIGTGVFFALNGNQTLGREESRGGHFLDRHDYCKLHIIAHYVQTLLGPTFVTIPIGFVGDDDAGSRLLREMAAAGFQMTRVAALPGEQTLFSTCFIYPDGSGGNLTTDDSANARVGRAEVRGAEPDFARFAGKGIALAAPEVSLEARTELLKAASEYGFFRAASFTSAESGEPLLDEILSRTDLLAINLDEAAALSRTSVEEDAAESVVDRAFECAAERQPGILVAITAGSQGSWIWNGEKSVHRPALPVQVVNTAGAGDAFLAGMLAALAAGLSFPDAQEFGTLVAAMSVTSPHTIHPGLNRSTLLLFVESNAIEPSREVAAFLRERDELQ